MKEFIQELHRRNAPFFYTGVVLSVLFLVFFLTIGFCSHSLSDICHWLKPCKFAISFALYVFALGWYLEYLKSSVNKRTIHWITGLITFFVSFEMVLILLQGGLSSASYQSLRLSPETTLFLSKSLYLSSNATIIADSLVVMYIAFQFCKPIQLQPTVYLWGIRTGFLIFILSGFLGGYLLEKYGQIPANQIGLGLPFTNFSARDNLISMHFLGIHYLQIIPLCCYYFHKYVGKKFILSSIGLYVMGCLFTLYLSFY